jgi:hypothetical protein
VAELITCSKPDVFSCAIGHVSAAPRQRTQDQAPFEHWQTYDIGSTIGNGQSGPLHPGKSDGAALRCGFWQLGSTGKQ